MGTCCRLARNPSVAASSLGRMPAYTSVMLIGQQASTWPDLTRSSSSVGRARLLFKTSMMTLVSSRNVAISAGGDFFKALVVFATQLLHPLGGSLFELGMVFVLPGSRRCFQ